MTLPHSDFERLTVDDNARRAIESHGQPEHSLDPSAREMKEKTHTGIELTGAELAYLQKITFDRIADVGDRISAIEKSLHERSVPNSRNSEEELNGLRKELHFLQNNLSEKLFG